MGRSLHQHHNTKRGNHVLQPTKDWDDAFANMVHIAGSDALPGLWADNAAAYRASGVNIEEDIAYGDHPREKFDLIWPDGTPKGVVVFIHGGFWMRLDKSFWSDLAEGARANGWAVCLPSYTLAPEARIHQMTAQIGAAITKVSARVAGPIKLSGHSAGGHLASRMVSSTSPLSTNILERINHTLSISGLHDLRPLLHTKMNDILRLDDTEAHAESAALLRPITTAPVTGWVGGGERPEFIRQTELLAQMWSGLDAQIVSAIDGQHNHFTVIEGLSDPKSAITTALLET
jgi:acetyl esterase/lipase